MSEEITKMNEKNTEQSEQITNFQKDYTTLGEKSVINSNHPSSSATSCITIRDTDSISDLDRLCELGAGCFALKELSNVNFEGLHQFFNEYEIMNMLQHPNILKVFGFFLSDETHPPFILIELCK